MEQLLTVIIRGLIKTNTKAAYLPSVHELLQAIVFRLHMPYNQQLHLGTEIWHFQRSVYAVRLENKTCDYIPG